MPLRPGRCYSRFDTPPYTRKEYIPGVPQPKITKFVMGDPKFQGDYKVSLIVTEAGQIRHNALESLRTNVLKQLTTSLGENKFLFVVKVYPHHVLRENKLMAFAGADRLQDGMRLSFGKPIGTAARVYPGQEIAYVIVKKDGVDKAKRALEIGSKKIPFPCRIEIEQLQESAS